MRRTSRRPANLSESLHRRLDAYALTAGAAGVGVLALVQPAKAKVVYTPANVTIGYGGLKSYDLALNRRGATDFVIATGTAGDGGEFYLGAIAKRRGTGDGIEVTAHRNHSAAAIYRGARIGSKQNFDSCCSAGLVNVVYSRSQTYGYWVNVRDRYLGLKLQIKGKTHFGWARMSVKVDLNPPCCAQITAKLTGYAYETVPNKPIIAGKTKGPDVITVQDGGLGHLAAGASAIPDRKTR
jgi:hypothetical protein